MLSSHSRGDKHDGECTQKNEAGEFIAEELIQEWT